MLILCIFFLLILSFQPENAFASTSIIGEDSKELEMEWQDSFYQLEVGGPGSAMEFFNNSVLPSRLNFYSPVANSVDVSNDYWSRGDKPIYNIAVKGEDQFFDMSQERNFLYKLTPYSLTFKKKYPDTDLIISYEFLRNYAAVCITIEITNTAKKEEIFSVLTSLDPVVRTCNNYTRYENSSSYFLDNGNVLFSRFPYEATGNAEIFTANAGVTPESYTSKYDKKMLYNMAHNDLVLFRLNKETYSDKNQRTAQTFLYKDQLQPGETMKIIQLVGSNYIGTETNIHSAIFSQAVLDYYKDDIQAQKLFIHSKVRESNFFINQPVVDNSFKWAQGVMNANIHQIGKYRVSTPCPTEYNFFFTHDALQAAMARLYSDTAQVKEDLKLITELTSDNVIPHAYYWKDNLYFTEYAQTDNWNHLWIILIASRYLKHASDCYAIKPLLPAMENGINQILKHRKSDGLIWNKRPDWWDIGNNYGPNVYMTAFTISALRELCYIRIFFDMNDKTVEYEKIANQMQKDLEEKLWDKNKNFFFPKIQAGNEHIQDEHLYSGAFLGCHLDSISPEKTLLMTDTAEKKLLAKGAGIMNAIPRDFHLIEEEMGFKKGEAGKPGYYFSGGVWNHINAWYMLSLLKTGQYEKAYVFLLNYMALDSIKNSPNGQAAFYEYRVTGKPDNPEYGRIDKPQFLWAASWYAYCCYNLIGIKQNAWNISIDPYIPPGSTAVETTFLHRGKKIRLSIADNGKYAKSIYLDNIKLNSLVIPENISGESFVPMDIILGNPDSPYLKSADSILKEYPSVEKPETFTVSLKAFSGHKSKFVIISPYPLDLTNDNENRKTSCTQKLDGNAHVLTYKFEHCEDIEIFEFTRTK